MLMSKILLTSDAKEPHKAQDLGEGEQEKMVDFILKPDPKVYIQTGGQGNERKSQLESCTSRNYWHRYLQCKLQCVTSLTTTPAESRQSLH